MYENKEPTKKTLTWTDTKTHIFFPFPYVYKLPYINNKSTCQPKEKQAQKPHTKIVPDHFQIEIKSLCMTKKDILSWRRGRKNCVSPGTKYSIIKIKLRRWE